MSGSDRDVPFSAPIFPPFHSGLARRPAQAPGAEEAAGEDASPPPFAPPAPLEPSAASPAAPEAEPAPWEAAGDEEAAAAEWEHPEADDGEDLPWLERPEGVPAAGAAAEPSAAAPEEDAPAGLPEWMDWDAGGAAAEGGEAEEPASDLELQPWDLAPEAPEADAEGREGLGSGAPDLELQPWEESPAPGEAALPEVGEEPWRAPSAEEWRAPASAAADEPWRAPEPELRPEFEAEPAGAAAPGPAAEPEPEETQAFEPPAAPPLAATQPYGFEPHLVPLGDFAGEEGAAPSAARGERERALAASLNGVADRLEAIARALRERPAGFLAGAGDDPLELLITGFALGYLQRPHRGGD